jgi:hypothetical protein
MRLLKFLEFVQDDFEPIKSFHLKDELNPKVWEDYGVIYPEIREQLLKIAQDFYNTTKLESKIKDIILTGSLANYNWSNKYSDYDLHILIDYNEVNDDYSLVENLVKSLKSIWNKRHNIFIKGYEVEVYIQDVNEQHFATGVFSLLNNKWNTEPSKKDFKPDEELIREKGEGVMISIDELEEEFDQYDYDELMENIKKIWDKIKKFRKSGLESEGGELSTGNLVFKLLRRNGYIEKIINMKIKAYDKQYK